MLAALRGASLYSARSRFASFALIVQRPAAPRVAVRYLLCFDMPYVATPSKTQLCLPASLFGSPHNNVMQCVAMPFIASVALP